MDKKHIIILYALACASCNIMGMNDPNSIVKRQQQNNNNTTITRRMFGDGTAGKCMRIITGTAIGMTTSVLMARLQDRSLVDGTPHTQMACSGPMPLAHMPIPYYIAPLATAIFSLKHNIFDLAQISQTNWWHSLWQNVARLSKWLQNNDTHIVNEKDSMGRTPLHIAANNGDLHRVHMLINSGADVNARDDFNNTPLHEASIKNNQNTAEMLINSGADVNARDDSNETPLHEASDTNNLNTAKVLINNGADVNARDNEYKTPLHEASIKNNLNIAEMLINNGADVNAIGYTVEDGADIRTSVLDSAIFSNNCKPALARMLIENGADITYLSYTNAPIPDDYINVLFRRNPQCGHMVKQLRDNGDIQFDITDNTTPEEMRDYVVLIVGRGLSHKLDEFTDDQKKMMIQSVWSKARERSVTAPVLKKLMHKYPTLYTSLQLDNGDTPLHVIARKKILNSLLYPYIVSILRLSNYDLRNNDGDTPQDIAERCGNYQFLHSWNNLLCSYACLTNHVPLTDDKKHLGAHRLTRRNNTTSQTPTKTHLVPQDVAPEILEYLDQ